MLREDDILRQVVIGRAELCQRLLPYLQERLKGSSPASLVHTILSDRHCAVAFGYRFPRKISEALVQDLMSDESSKRAEALPAGRILQSTILYRAVVYMRFVRNACIALHHAECLTRAESILAVLQAAFSDDYNNVQQLARLVETQVPSDAMALTPDTARAVEQALLDGGRLYVDRAVDAALWLLETREALPDLRRSDFLRRLIRDYVKARVEAHISADLATQPAGSNRLSDPAIVLWVVVVLLEHGHVDAEWCNRVLRRLRDSEAHIALAPSINTDLLATPELFEKRWRSDALSVFDLALLSRKPGIDHDAARQLVHRFTTEMLDGPPPPRRNLHFVSQRLLAFESLVGNRAPKHTPSRDFSFESSVMHASEINIGEFRAIGDYLIWRDDPADRTDLETRVAGLQEDIGTYLHAQPRRPLNILLWAQPGSGKSFFVKNVIKDLPKIAKSFVEVNAAQLSKPEELRITLRRVTSAIGESGTAAFFLDEADTALPDRKDHFLFPYLLMPMWDGEYLSDGQTLLMKRVVWFHAVSHGTSLDDFTTWAEMQEKGPDFISRIHRTIVLDPLNGRSQLLILLGNLSRIHAQLFVERGVLEYVATHQAKGGARAIEKAAMLLPLRGERGTVHLADLLRLLPAEPRIDWKLGHWTPDFAAAHAAEEVAVVDL